MSKKIINLVIMILIICTCTVIYASCTEQTTGINIGFKTTAGAAKYDESIDAFEIGKTFYTCVKMKIVTNKKKQSNYSVVIEVPKTKDIEITNTGSDLTITSNNYDASRGVTTINLNMQGSKEAVENKVLFKGTPFSEGSATIGVKVYDDDGTLINSAFRTVDFVFEVI